MRIDAPMKLGRGQNDREHYMARSRRVRKEKDAVGWLLAQFNHARPALPVVVTLTRISPATAKRVDDDNLSGSMKNVRDAVATWLGVDDGDRDKVRFEYRDEQGPWGLRIEA